jgi:hypothetical protein
VREPIHDFEYDDAWYPVTDGHGFSLVIRDDTAALDTWGLMASWRPSGLLNGSPAQNDPPQPNFPLVVINEILTHSDPPPPTDTVELLNLSGAVANIGGWFLTDDFRNPKKYVITGGTTITRTAPLPSTKTSSILVRTGFRLVHSARRFTFSPATARTSPAMHTGLISGRLRHLPASDVT